jgi:hypothetical protein
MLFLRDRPGTLPVASKIERELAVVSDGQQVEGVPARGVQDDVIAGDVFAELAILSEAFLQGYEARCTLRRARLPSEEVLAQVREAPQVRDDGLE